MHRRRLVLIVGIAALSACGSAGFVSTWTAPLESPLELDRRRVAAVVVTADESHRRAGEDALARELSSRGAQGIAAYTLVRGGARGDEAATLGTLRSAELEAAVVMRVVPAEEALPEPPGSDGYAAPHYASFWDYWARSFVAIQAPDALGSKGDVSVECVVYSLTRNELLWAGRSEPTSPEDIGSFLRRLSNPAANHLRRAGFLPK